MKATFSSFSPFFRFSNRSTVLSCEVDACCVVLSLSVVVVGGVNLGVGVLGVVCVDGDGVEVVDVGVWV